MTDKNAKRSSVTKSKHSAPMQIVQTTTITPLENGAVRITPYIAELESDVQRRLEEERNVPEKKAPSVANGNNDNTITTTKKKAGKEERAIFSKSHICRIILISISVASFIFVIIYLTTMMK